MQFGTWQKIISWLQWLLEKFGVILSEAEKDQQAQEKEDAARIEQEIKDSDAAVAEEYDDKKVKDTTNEDEVLDFWDKFGDDDDASHVHSPDSSAVGDQDRSTSATSGDQSTDETEIKSSQSGG